LATDAHQRQLPDAAEDDVKDQHPANTHQLGAAELAHQIRSGAVSVTDAVEASLSRIKSLDDVYEAFIYVDEDGARAVAEEMDRGLATEARGPLFGVPVAIKDVTDVRGMPTTHGSLLKGHTPAHADEVSVARLRAAGAVIVGKTNTPEFGFGAVCTNRLRGPTRNPWNPALTSGGSSGGSAVAVTSGMVSLAHGSDFGGSIRTPASFTGCVGLRPTPGLIPEPTRPLGWNTLATQGVLARSADDAALMLRVMAGAHRHDPQSLLLLPGQAPTQLPLRVAATATMRGAYRINPDVRALFDSAVTAASKVFGTIEEDAPRAESASDAFKVLRAAQSWATFGATVEEHSDALTDSFIWNVRSGQDLSAEDYLKAEQVRTRTYRAFQDFFDRYDILLLPAASVLPFPDRQREVMSIDGVCCDSIIDYLACTYLISLVGFPALVLPAPVGDGLPFGVQLVARPGGEEVLFQAARMLEESAGFRHIWPAFRSSIDA
jgi:amidase